ncbi:MFS family permease [Kutzneria kofuensis]|uniref:alpha-amylase n=1 Tax=Kutzneria kofuensis TaxID=103725 RepID=A0A7W9NFC9_9PSEU|nr:MFS family permease [Kutzneria kofuensis]
MSTAQHAKTAALGPRYKWIALSNTTLGMLMATINSSIVLIALPDIFKGIGINPLSPDNTSYLLWMMMGFLVVTAVLVVSFGRLGDMYGRVKMYNMGFAIFAISSVLLSVTWFNGTDAALWLIGWRVVQGIGGAFLMANSSAILTDAFPANQRGTALGLNAVAAIAGSFLGLVLGGVLAPVDWHLVFIVSAPFGVFGTIWAYLKLHDNGIRQKAKMDWWGNVTFAVGLIVVLVAITYGIQPYGDSSMGWGNPWVYGSLIGGIAVLVVFGVIETKVANPLFNLSLFKIRAFTAGNVANLLASLGRGGLQFVLIIWLQGIWLPQHGYSFESTPLWAGIYMLPLTVGFLVSAPLSGVLSDRLGARAFTTGGMLITAASFVALILLPVDFNYWIFAIILLVNGLGMGLFSSPNRADVMNSLPTNARGVGAGMTATFQNSAMVLSIGIFFSLIIAGLSASLPGTLSSGLVSNGVPQAAADQVAALPAVGVLFAAFLGYNPIQQLLGPVLQQLPADKASFLTGRSFFPNLISGPFQEGLQVVFWFAVVACVIAAIASWLVGKRNKAIKPEPVGEELAAVAGEGAFGDVDLVVPVGTVVLSGRVYTRGGSGVGGAVVTVTGPDGSQVDRVPVDSDGGYRLVDLRNGTYTLIVTAPGYRPAAGTIAITDKPGVQDFELAGGGLIAGTVRSDGIPVPLAAILVSDVDGQILAQVAADEAGRYRIEGLPAGDAVLTASAPGYEQTAEPIGVSATRPSTVDLELPTQAAVHGVVTAPDGPVVAGATVTALDGDGRVVATAVTGPDGSYRLTGLPSGDYTVVTSVYEPVAVRVSARAGELSTADVVFGR